MAYMLKITGTNRSVDVDGDTPLLWVPGDVLGMTGATFGSGPSDRWLHHWPGPIVPGPDPLSQRSKRTSATRQSSPPSGDG
jgi:hypothetical protein